jgi:energy-converting hydrogenase Eha subunit B
MTGLLLFAIVGGPLETATVIGVTVLAMNVGYRHPAGRLALAAAVLHTAALGVWLGVMLRADPGAAGVVR